MSHQPVAVDLRHGRPLKPGLPSAAKLLTKDEARRIAANIAKLRELQRNHPPKIGGCVL